MSMRKKVKGIYIVPEMFKLLNTSLQHVATNYKIYADRLKQQVLLDVIITSESKVGYTYYNNDLYDDQVLYFTTNIKLSDDSWCGESPLTRVVLRQDQFSSNGIIVTPIVTTDLTGVTGGFNIVLSDFIRYDGDSSSLESTTYRIINELDGTIVFEREDDRTNLHKVYVPLDTLQPDKIYRISARYRDAVGRYSNYGSLIYTAMNVLYSMFKDDTISAMYGSKIALVNSVTEIIPTDEIRAIVYRDGIEVGSSVYDNDLIIIDTKGYEVGDELDVLITYKDYSRPVKVFIKKTVIKKEIDLNYNYENTFDAVTLPVNFIVKSGTTQEFSDGNIYTMDEIGNLFSYKFDALSNSIIDYRKIASFTGVVGLTNYRQRIFENPIDGNLIIYSVPTNVLTSNPHYIIVIDKYTMETILIEPINLAIDGVSHQGEPIILDNHLYLFSAYSPSDALKKDVYKLNLITYKFTLIGMLNFPNIVANPNSISNVVGLTPVLYTDNQTTNSSVMFISLGGNNDTNYTTTKEVFLWDIKSGSLNTTTHTILDKITGIQNGNKASILTTLKNGKIGLIYANHTTRDKKGIMYIDLETAIVTDNTTLYTSTSNLENVVVLNDGTFLFLNGNTGVRFK